MLQFRFGRMDQPTVLIAVWSIVAIIVVPMPVESAEQQHRVRIVPVPEHGRPVAAKVDSTGAIHLLFNLHDTARYAVSKDGKEFASSIPVMEGRDALKVDSRLIFEGADLALGKNGRVHVVLESPNAWKLRVAPGQWGMYYAHLDAGAKRFSPVRSINAKPSEGFSLAADEGGHVAAVWMADKLYANVSTNGGESFGPAFEVDPACDPCNCCTTSSVYMDKGRLGILYREETNDERDMHLLTLDHANSRTTRNKISTTPWKIAKCPMTYYQIAPAPGGFIAAWPTGDQYEIHFARLNREGKVTAPGEVKTPGRAFHRTSVLALAAPDGSVLIAWTRQQEVGWQLYDEQSRPVGAPGRAKGTGKSLAGVVDSTGNYLLFP